MAKTVPPRSAIPRKYRWNAEHLFSSPKAWETELTAILEAIPKVEALRGKLGVSPAALAEGLACVEDLAARMHRALVYAGFSYSVDTADQKAAAMNDRAQGAFGRVGAAISFVDPDLIAIGRETLVTWTEQESRLSCYRHYFHNLFRKQAHVRSSEVEELMGMLSDPFSGPSNTHSMLTNADIRFPPARNSRGARVPVSQGTLPAILEDRDRAARSSAWRSYTGMHVEYRNTLAAVLTGSIKQNVFKCRARRFDSTLEAALFADNVPVQVFHNAIDVFRARIPLWQRYFEIRRRALRLGTMRHSDMWAPLAKTREVVSYEQAVRIICKGLAPMGKEYVSTVREGCLKGRWVDVLPNRGKREGAFSWGAFGTLPYIMMSFTGDVTSLSVLAHELGHSMHSLLTWKSQPYVYSPYSTFIAEVASNVHQALVRAFLLRPEAKRDLRIAVLEEAMANFFRYLFLMPTLARFELETHQRVERGEALTAETMTDVMVELLEEGYGKTVRIERNREGMLWAAFPHLFEDYYAFQYETGIAGAQAIAKRILLDDDRAVDKYIRFLSSGSSDYPIDALRRAGVDLARPEPVEEAFDVMAGYIDQLESLLL
jgi:oligoendopeptidase F